MVGQGENEKTCRPREGGRKVVVPAFLNRNGLMYIIAIFEITFVNMHLHLTHVSGYLQLRVLDYFSELYHPGLHNLP